MQINTCLEKAKIQVISAMLELHKLLKLKSRYHGCDMNLKCGLPYICGSYIIAFLISYFTNFRHLFSSSERHFITCTQTTSYIS